MQKVMETEKQISSTGEVVEEFTDEQIDALLGQLDPLITANYLGRLTEDCYELTAFLPSESAGIAIADAWRRVPCLIRQLRAALRQREIEAQKQERERAMRIVNERIAACDRRIALNDGKGRDWNFDCWRDMSNTLRTTLGAIGTGPYATQEREGS